MSRAPDPRSAGDVRRYHTWRVLQQQTNAAHQWNVARILLAIYPDCSPRLLREALFHDVGEVVSGDAPFPIKRDNPDIKAGHDRVERSARSAMVLPWGVPPEADLDDFEKRVLKLADLTEMWEFALDDVNYGNRHAQLIVDRCDAELTRLMGGIVGDVRLRFEAYRNRRLLASSQQELQKEWEIRA